MSVLAADTLEVVVITTMCVSAFLGSILAISKGRSLAWCGPCVLFPPFLLILYRLPPTKMADKIRCPCCEFVNPLRRDTCAKCGMELDTTKPII